MKINFECDFITLAYSDIPWSLLPVVNDKSANITQLEFAQDVAGSRFRELNVKELVSYLNENIFTFGNLLKENKEYSLAVRSLSFDHLQRDLRLKLANLWLGIEALFPSMSELSFRLSVYITMLLCENGQDKFQVFKDIQKLYTSRSKAVHGAQISEEAMQKDLRETRRILRGLILKYLDLRYIPKSDQLNKALFGIELTPLVTPAPGHPPNYP